MRQSLLIILLLNWGIHSFSQNFSEQQRQEIDSINHVIADAETHDTLKVHAWLNLAGYYYQHNLDTILTFCHNAEKIAEENNYLFGMSESYGWLGYTYINLGELDSGLYYNNKSIGVSMQTGDLETTAAILYNNGHIYMTQGKTDKSLEAYMSALKIYEQMDNQVEIARTYNSIALIYKNQGFYDKALDFYNRSLLIRQEFGNKKDIAESLNNIGVLYEYIGDYDKVMPYYRKSLQLRREADYPVGIANSLENISNYFHIIGQLDSSLIYIQEAVAIREKLGLKPGLCEVYIDLGKVYTDLGDMTNAKKYGEMGYQLALELGYPLFLQNSAIGMTQVYKKSGQYKKALEAYELYVEMRDSLMNLKTQKQTVERDAQYAYEKQKAIDDAEHEKLLAIEAEKKEKQQILTVATAIGLLLVVGFLIFVFNRLRITRQQKKVIEKQKTEVESQKAAVERAHEILEEKNTEILDSIAYAKRIQSAILPSDNVFKKHLPDSFVLYKPKDIVAGDFYWLESTDNELLFAAADCTGHGVPGAMVSVVCNNGLNRSVREYKLRDPGKILDKTREIIIEEFQKSDEDVKDGMDIALCSLRRGSDSNEHLEKGTDKSNHGLNGFEVHYAGANNPLWIIRNGSAEIEEVKADKQPIGLFDDLSPFTTHSLKLHSGDTIYIFSDGYPDQFGGTKGKKMKSKTFKETLLSIKDKPMSEQKEFLDKNFENWKGEFEQIDDVLVIGVRV
ncbi:MAG: tetratricopeptide repeat protein [Crocinitomicaceae bacterium]|nr:tetratricopeptide repeat protein [Crocinitomicaceae bacterium]